MTATSTKSSLAGFFSKRCNGALAGHAAALVVRPSAEFRLSLELLTFRGLLKIDSFRTCLSGRKAPGRSFHAQPRRDSCLYWRGGGECDSKSAPRVSKRRAGAQTGFGNTEQQRSNATKLRVARHSQGTPRQAGRPCRDTANRRRLKG